ncbi:MAG: TonB C-terminal domain-containing protein [Akkermansiaceae bacterium]|nr:TonB C-terminal domain-containing protein [Akkermansiaceae bacterium]
MNPPAKSNKHKFIIAGMLALVLGGGIISFLTAGPKEPKKATRKNDNLVQINIPPPPPPPPPPKIEPPKPKEEEPKEEEMIEEVAAEETPPEAPPEAPPAETIGTNIKGDGPGMSGLSSGGGNGGGNRNSIGGDGRRGSKYGGYAFKIQQTIKSALSQNSSTRSASFSMQVRVWADANGRITRASLVGSSGNPAVDQAIRNQVLVGLQLPEPPPADMPMPINLRISARKSS